MALSKLSHLLCRKIRVLKTAESTLDNLCYKKNKTKIQGVAIHLQIKHQRLRNVKENCHLPVSLKFACTEIDNYSTGSRRLPVSQVLLKLPHHPKAKCLANYNF